ncbi:hypothetical protein A1O1_09070 [Capronia coronata CBS 617.96]|uniref:Oxidoreductase n=1 Tax=Capronia coronata CBS 617.96 TaxID=1182541 RepID=W9Y8D4_9EURO|nr:uncharacterized protein A1O1_09070 [Capronia coronata CBS 617.96]EXJ78669.1 hypothetical protein A1O1_09070 [Capronia coronata CBS 617.96]
MPFPYKKVLVTGATSGIGEALTRRLVEDGSFVIAVGRRKENLDKLVQEYGRDKIDAVSFDVSNLEAIPQFATKIIDTHPDVDCVVLNAGVQRRSDFSEPESIDMAVLELEFRTNYLSPLTMTKAFLPYFQKKEGKSAFVYVTSGLALVPILRCPNYCATKAALHQFILCLRESLKSSNVKVVEVFPPAVQTELHDEKHQPDIKNGRSWGMPLAEFTDEAYAGLASGSEQVPVGHAKKMFDGLEPKRQELFQYMVKASSGT